MHTGTKGNNALYKDLWYNLIVCAFWSVSSKKKFLLNQILVLYALQNQNFWSPRMKCKLQHFASISVAILRPGMAFKILLMLVLSLQSCKLIAMQDSRNGAVWWKHWFFSPVSPRCTFLSFHWFLDCLCYLSCQVH